MDTADDSILEDSGFASEGFGSEAADEIPVVDDGYREFKNLVPVSWWF